MSAGRITAAVRSTVMSTTLRANRLTEKVQFRVCGVSWQGAFVAFFELGAPEADDARDHLAGEGSLFIKMA
jgi:hypothetical protein